VLGCLKQCEVSLTCSYRLILLCQKEKNLVKAIKESKIVIIVLSKTYAFFLPFV
jgi:hypothetical protein